jgi:hypothetical protein
MILFHTLMRKALRNSKWTSRIVFIQGMEQSWYAQFSLLKPRNSITHWFKKTPVRRKHCLTTGFFGDCVKEINTVTSFLSLIEQQSLPHHPLVQVLYSTMCLKLMTYASDCYWWGWWCSEWTSPKSLHLRPALRLAQPTIQWVPEVKLPKREAETHLQLVPRSIKLGSKHLLSHTSSWLSV